MIDSTYNNIILFDGVCNLCNQSVNFIIKKDKNATFKFASLQSDFAKNVIKYVADSNIVLNADQSLLLIKNNKVYKQSNAALLIAKELKWPWKLLYIGIIIPKCVRDLIYKWIAGNRYRWFGRSESCSIPDESIQGRF